MFKLFKKLFKPTITAPPKSEKYSVFLSSAKNWVRLFAKLEVKPNFSAVITANNKVYDVFNEGNYELTTANLPYCTKKFKLVKPSKTGTIPKGFPAEIYYVNKNEFNNIPFSQCKKIKVQDKNYYTCHVGFKAQFSYKIKDPAEYIGALFYEFGKIKGNMAEEQLALWVSKVVCKRLEKSKLQLEKFYARDSECFVGLVDFVNKEFSDIGVEVLNIDFLEVILPKSVYKKTKLEYNDVHVKKQEEIKQIDEQIDRAESDMKPSTNYNVYDYTVVQPQQMHTPNYHQPQSQMSLPNNQSPQQNQNTITRVDYSINIEYKICPNCGAQCPKDATICFICSSKLN